MTMAVPESHIKELIFTFRGVQIISDKDLSGLYSASTKALNQAVKRNSDCFPLDFMFQLTKK